jgi:CheY-like chemotaxis protein
MKRLKLPYKTASNGREALDNYSASSGRFCCVLMDISMPVMDGLEATRRIREFERKNKVNSAVIIALTGLASSSTQQEAFASGIDMFMSKPVRLKDLAEVLGMDSRR